MTEHNIAPEVLAAEAKELFDSAVEILQQIERFDIAIIKAQRLAEEISRDIRSKEYGIKDSSLNLERLLQIQPTLSAEDTELPTTTALMLALFDTEREFNLDYLNHYPQAEREEVIANNPISMILKKIVKDEGGQPKLTNLDRAEMGLIIDSVRSKIESIHEELPQLQREIEEAETQQVALQDSLQEIQDNREKAVAEYRRLVGKLNNLESQLFSSETGLSQPESNRDQQQRRYLATLSQRVDLYQLTKSAVEPKRGKYLIGSCSLHAEDGQELLGNSTINSGRLEKTAGRDHANVISAAFDRVVPVGALFLRPVPNSDGHQETFIEFKGEHDELVHGKIDSDGVFSSSW